MAEELSIVVPAEEEELSIDVPSTSKPKERKSNVTKQAIASVADLFTDLPGLVGLIGSGLQAGTNYALDDSDKTFGEQFAEASASGIDKTLLGWSEAGRAATNEALGIQEPMSTEDILARNAALFLPIPGLALAKGASRLAKLGSGAANVVLPTVKRGTKKSMLTRAGIQGGIGLGVDQGVRALVDSPELPLLFSESALAGGHAPEEEQIETELQQGELSPELQSLLDDPIAKRQYELMGGSADDELSINVPAELSVNVPEELSINVPSEPHGVVVQDRLDMDTRMQKAADWGTVRNVAIVVGGILGGSYLTKRLTKVDNLSAPPTPPSPGFSSGKHLHRTMVDRGKITDDVFEEMGVDDVTREGVDANTHSDVAGMSREAVKEGKYGQGFDNNKWKAHSETVLDNDYAVLKQANKHELFNDAMKAQSELAATRRGKREASMWRKNISDKKLDETVAKAWGDKDVSTLMRKHAQNYRADLEYEVHRGLTTRNDADEILEVFGDITKTGEKGTYMPFYGMSGVGLSRALAKKFLGINTKKGDELRTVAEFQARGGGRATKILNPGDAIKRHRLHNAAYVNDQLYRSDVLSKLAGIQVGAKGVTRLVFGKGGKFVKSTRGALGHDETGRGTHLLAVGDDIKTDPNNIHMKVVTDDKLVNLKDQSINDLRNTYGKQLEVVQHQGKLYAYLVPDEGVRAALDLSPKLGKILEFNNHWKNVFTKFTTGDYSLFAPISHIFSSQQVALATTARARKDFAAQGKSFAQARAIGEGFKSMGRSLGGSRDIFMDQTAGILANYLSRAIATKSGFGKNAHKLQATLHNRYSNSLLAKIRSETGRTTTGIGSVDHTLDSMLNEFGTTFSDFYGANQMGVIKNVWKAFNNAANEGASFGAIQREIGKMVQEGRQPNISQIRKAVNEGKTLAGDFSRRGSSKLAVGINASIPFSSAMIQSWNALGSAARYDWKSFAVGAGALIGAPTMMELGMNAALSKTGMTFKDASGKDWTYDDYYWNGYTTQQRNDNMILFVPGRPPWEAIVMPVAPEWGLFRAITIESADALFNLSRTGSIGVADDGRDRVGRDHFLGALHRVFDLPLPPLGAAVLSKMGLDLRAGFNLEEGEDPADPETSFSFLKGIPIGTGERISSRMGRTKDVNGSIDKRTSAAIKDIWGAGGTAYVAFHEAINSGITNRGGGITRGLEQGLDSILDSGRRQARFTNPFGKVFKPTSHDEIGTSLHGKRQALKSLSKDMDVLMGGKGFIQLQGQDVPVDTVIPTQDPIRQELAQDSKAIMSNIAMVDKTIATLRAEISKIGLATNLGSIQERQDIIDGKELEIQAFKAQQLGALQNFEDIWSESLTKKYGRDITINLSGGLGNTIGARPNLDSTSPVLPKLPQTSR